LRRLLRLGVLAAAPWPLAYACATPAFARAYPRRTVIRGLYLAAYVAAAVLCAVLYPLLLVPFAVVAAAGLAAGLWMARPSAGRADGLPPGSLSLIPVRQFVDQEFVERQIDRLGAVTKTTWPTLTGSGVCVHGLRRSAELLRDRDSLAPVGIAFDPLIPAGFLRNMAPPEHRRYKRLFQDALTDEVVEANLDSFDGAVHDLLAALASAGDGGTDPRPHLLRASAAAYVPLLLGVERGSAEAARALEIYDEIGEFFEPPAADSKERRAFQAAADELDRILRHGAAQALEALEAGREPTPSIVSEIARSEPAALDDPNVTLNLVFLLRTSSTDVGSLLHWALKTLGDHPEWCARVRDDRTDGVARRVVLETLRLHQSEFIQRRVLQPLEIDGYRIPAGWFVRLCVRESHRDPAVFPEPGVFDPDRFAELRFSAYEYSPFGRLEHRCIGVTTTLELARIFVDRLCTGYDWGIVRDGPAEFNRYHWQPSRRFRVRLAARGPG
jgi:cytochrome P450